MSRFSKASAIEQIQARAEAHRAKEEFTLNTGTSQLLLPGSGPNLERLINRAVAYGSMIALTQVAIDIDSGHLGVSSPRAK